jgi:hypothetical protein
MTQNVVLDTQGARPDETGRTFRASAMSRPSVDPVRALAESMRSAALAHPGAGTRSTRPFDAQYWACWVVAVVFPLLLTYLWFTR